LRSESRELAGASRAIESGRFTFLRRLHTFNRVLYRRSFENGVVAYCSEKLQAAGVRHAFSTRLGGISPKPFDSLNLGNPSGAAMQDSYDRIWANYARLLAAIGCPSEPPLRVHQVHSDGVVDVAAGDAFDCSATADAIISDDPARVISVRVADCVPVLLASTDGKIVAAIHAGWRGVVAGVVPVALARLVARGKLGSGKDVIAAIGPCISQSAFEVGPEVVEEFRNLFGDDALVRQRADGKGHIDLRRAIQIQLAKAGVSADQVDVGDRCTFRDADEFYSHRRDHGVTGRMAAVIAPSALK
jgi:YfiH family protein